jgi:hypothetical protein
MKADAVVNKIIKADDVWSRSSLCCEDTTKVNTIVGIVASIMANFKASPSIPKK